jgi:protein-disulfide isomerase
MGSMLKNVIIATVVIGVGGAGWRFYTVQQAILEELRSGAQRGTAAKQVPGRLDLAGKEIDLKDLPQAGDPKARIVLVDVSDYQCPFCQRFFSDTYPALQSDYVQSGKIRYTHIDLPAEAPHPLAMKAAIASHCANDQGAYWKMHDNLFKQRVEKPEDITAAGKASSLKMQEFNDCVASEKHIQDIIARRLEFMKLGIMGTPYFVIGVVKPGSSKVIVKSTVMGAMPLANFKKQLDEALSGA